MSLQNDHFLQSTADGDRKLYSQAEMNAVIVAFNACITDRSKLAAELATASCERDHLLGIFSDYEWHCPDVKTAQKVFNGIRQREHTAITERDAAEKALLDAESTVEFALKREMESPSNHQEFAEEARLKLRRFRAAVALAAGRVYGQS